MAYFTGLRKGDLFGIKLSDVDLKAEEIRFTAEKTGKEMVLPLHPCAVEHVRRIWGDREFLFPPLNIQGGHYTQRWKQIVKQAGVDPFTLKDVRRVACSELDRIQPGMGAVLLQHRPLDVTGMSYLNKLPELAESIGKMRVPLAFKHGPRKSDREAILARQAREKLMRDSQFQPPCRPAADEFRFQPNRFWLRGSWRKLSRAPWRVLKTLVEAEGPVDVDRLADVVFDGSARPDELYRVQYRVHGCVSVVRDRLRRALYLDETFNPVPCVKRGAGGEWALLLPAEPKPRRATA